MTTPMDDTLTAIGRQLSVAYLPTVLEPLPRELNDLVAQLVAFEMRKQKLSEDLRRPCSSLWHSSRRTPAPPIRQSDDSLMRGSSREPHHEIGLLALQPAHCLLSR